MTSLLHRLGHATASHPYRTLAAWVLILVGSVLMATKLGGALNDSSTVPASSSERAAERLAAGFPDAAGAEAHLVAYWAEGPTDLVAITRTERAVRELPGVRTVRIARDPDDRTVMIIANYAQPVTDLDAGNATDRLTAVGERLSDSGATVAVGGEIPESIQGPNGVAEAAGVAAALVVLLLAFGSVLAAGLPLVIAGVGLGVGLSLITLLAQVTDVNTVSPTLGSMLGLGVGIDYGLFIVARHRQGLAAGRTPVAAAAAANATAGKSVVFAGLSVLIGITGLALCGIPSFASMGLAAGLVILATMAVSISLLPALLGLLGHRVFGRRARRSGILPADSFHSAGAERFTRAVVRRPGVWVTVSVLILLALASPALTMRLGQNDAGSENRDNPTRIAYDLVAAAFGPGANGPLTVVVDRRLVPGVGALRDRLAGIDGVQEVAPAIASPDRSTAVLQVTPTTGPQDAATRVLVETLHSVLPEGADLTGPTAAVLDMTSVLGARLWIVILAVLAATFLLLLVGFRSVVLPLKAVLGNLLSVCAAFGVLTMAFQTTVGVRLLGLPGPVPIAAWAPVVLFAILFGLSMDYEVFMLSAIRERHEAGLADRDAVAAGLGSTARIVTSAAAIMIAVAAGFAFDPSVMVKIIGVGMVSAILVDVTLVRMLLVPAAIALLGRANWYLPAWLGRYLPGVAAEEEEQAAAPPPEPPPVNALARL